MSIEFPIQFKYFSIRPGAVQRQSVNDMEQDGYEVHDPYGVVVASGTNLYRLLEFCMQSDVQAEMASQMNERWVPTHKHLDGVDIDRKPDMPTGIMIPAGGPIQGGGGEGGYKH